MNEEANVVLLAAGSPPQAAGFGSERSRLHMIPHVGQGKRFSSVSFVSTGSCSVTLRRPNSNSPRRPRIVRVGHSVPTKPIKKIVPAAQNIFVPTAKPSMRTMIKAAVSAPNGVLIAATKGSANPHQLCDVIQ